MERNRMETEFAEKLSQREIQPSAASWDRLDAMLTASEAKAQPSGRGYKWLFVAAGFLGFLLVGSIFWRAADLGRMQHPNTDKGVSETQRPLKKNDVETLKVVEKHLAQLPDENPSAEAKKTGSKTDGRLSPVANPAEFRAQLAQTAASDSETNKAAIINQNADISHQNSSQIARDATVDALLADAKSKRENGESGAKVNARKLLQEVDSQAEEKLTTRQRALRALNRNYQQVKVAVENRNYEESH